MVLFRRLLGDVLRRHRQRQGRTLRDVAAAARISLGYLSEVERGRKEASSELLASLCEALDVSLADVLREVSHDIAVLERGPLMPAGFAPNHRAPSHRAPSHRAANHRAALQSVATSTAGARPVEVVRASATADAVGSIVASSVPTETTVSLARMHVVAA